MNYYKFDFPTFPVMLWANSSKLNKDGSFDINTLWDANLDTTSAVLVFLYANLHLKHLKKTKINFIEQDKRMDFIRDKIKIANDNDFDTVTGHFVHLYEIGFTLVEIANLYQIGRTTVARYIRIFFNIKSGYNKMRFFNCRCKCGSISWQIKEKNPKTKNPVRECRICGNIQEYAYIDKENCFEWVDNQKTLLNTY